MTTAITPIAGKSGWFLTFGILYILAGFAAIVSPFIVTVASVFFLGVILVVAGIAGLIHSFSARGWEGFAVQLLGGILAVVMGFLLIVDAAAGAVVITLILAMYFLIGGMFRLGFALSHPGSRHRGSFLFSGFINVLLGILILIHWPSSALWVIGTFIGIDLIFYGAFLISLSRALKAPPAAAV